MRCQAVQDVQTEWGWEGVLKFAGSVRLAWDLGYSVGDLGSSENDLRVLPRMLSDANSKIQDFARGCIWRRFQIGGWDWIRQLPVKEWGKEDVAKMLLVLPNEKATWDYAIEQGTATQSYYWEHTRSAIWEPTSKTVGYAVTKLIECGRTIQASFVLAMARHRNQPIDTELALLVLESTNKSEIKNPEVRLKSQAAHNLVELIEHIQLGVTASATEEQLHRVAKIEWSYLRLLNGHPARPVTLLRLLRTHPDFFVQLLCMIFRAENDTNNSPPTEDEKARAHNAYELLGSFTRIPGSRDDDSVDTDELMAWVRQARELAIENNRIAICDERIGEVLAYAPIESVDNARPCIPVRCALEELGTEEMLSGFEIGFFNQRGAHWKSLDDGGSQERRLSQQFRDWAQASLVEWPKTAASLRRMAENYERDAARADAESQLRLT